MAFFLFEYDDVCLHPHVAQCLGHDMILSYCVLIAIVLSFAGSAEHDMHSR